MLTLNYRDSRPIYEQIKDGLRRMIVTGAMAQDEKLPSVRALATQLSINPKPSSGPITSWKRKAIFTPWRERAASSAVRRTPTLSGGKRFGRM